MLSPEKVVKALSDPVVALLVKKAVAEVERERVDKIQRRVLAENEFQGKRLKRDGDGDYFRVTDPKDAWMMEDDVAKRYFDILKQIHLAEGFKDAEKGHCPALVAEYEQTQAEWALIAKARQFFPTVTNDALLASGGCEMRKKYLDLIIGLVLSGSKT